MTRLGSQRAPPSCSSRAVPRRNARREARDRRPVLRASVRGARSGAGDRRGTAERQGQLGGGRSRVGRRHGFGGRLGGGWSAGLGAMTGVGRDVGAGAMTRAAMTCADSGSAATTRIGRCDWLCRCSPPRRTGAQRGTHRHRRRRDDRSTAGDDDRRARREHCDGPPRLAPPTTGTNGAAPRRPAATTNRARRAPRLTTRRSGNGIARRRGASVVRPPSSKAIKLSIWSPTGIATSRKRARSRSVVKVPRRRQRVFSVPLRLRRPGAPSDRDALQEVSRAIRSHDVTLDRPARRGLVPRRHRRSAHPVFRYLRDLRRQAARLLRARCTRTCVDVARRSPRRGRHPGEEDLRDDGVVATELTGIVPTSRHVLPRPRSQVPAVDLLRGRRPGARHAHARERVRGRAASTTRSCSAARAAAARPRSRASSARRSNCEGRRPARASRAACASACVSIDERQRGRLSGDGRRVEPRHRRDPRADRGGALPARGAAQEGLRHRRSPHAHDRGVQRAAEDARGAAAARHVRARDDRAAQAARTRSCRAASATTSSSCRRRGSRST